MSWAWRCCRSCQCWRVHSKPPLPREMTDKHLNGMKKMQHQPLSRKHCIDIRFVHFIFFSSLEACRFLKKAGSSRNPLCCIPPSSTPRAIIFSSRPRWHEVLYPNHPQWNRRQLSSWRASKPRITQAYPHAGNCTFWSCQDDVIWKIHPWNSRVSLRSAYICILCLHYHFSHLSACVHVQ